MHFMKAIAIFITRIFARRMIDGLVLIAPFFKTRVNIVLIRVQQATRLNHLHQHRFDRYLLDIGQHSNHDFPIPLQQAQDRGFSSANVPLQFHLSSRQAFFNHHAFPQLGGHALHGVCVYL
jgi:hypothetical protein